MSTTPEVVITTTPEPITTTEQTTLITTGTTVAQTTLVTCESAKYCQKNGYKICIPEKEICNRKPFCDDGTDESFFNFRRENCKL